MKCAIIGAGPAGLYLGLLLRMHFPRADINLFESSDAIGNSEFGYTLHQPTVERLLEVDPIFLDFTYEQSCPMWQAVEFCLGSYMEQRSRGRYGSSIGITRGSLLTRLRQLALSKGCSLRIQRVSVFDIRQLERDFDIVVGADGLSSVVRDHIATDINATTLINPVPFIWARKSVCVPQMRQAFAPTDLGTLLITEYPVSRTSSTVVLEFNSVLASALNPSNWNSRTVLNLVGEMLANFDPGSTELIAHLSACITRIPRLNRCCRQFSRNCVLVGDAGFTIHHSLGLGVYYAFEEARLLCEAIKGSHNISDAVADYDAATNAILQFVQNRSMARMLWLEQFDQTAMLSNSDPEAIIAKFIDIGRLH